MSMVFIGEAPSSPAGLRDTIERETTLETAQDARRLLASPSRSSALSGAIGRRLARLCSTTPEDLEQRIDRVNLIPEALKIWDHRRARRNAMFLLAQLGSYDVVILCGRRVAKAFGLSRIAYLEPHTMTRVADYSAVTFVVMPHPSGRNRWYNDQKNVELLTRELTALYRRHANYVYEVPN